MAAPLFAYLCMGLCAVSGVGALIFSMRKPAAKPCVKCGRAMMTEWTQCLFCGTPVGGAQDVNKPCMLHFVGGPLNDQVAILEKPVTTIGSAPGNDVVLKDLGVSRKHVGIRKVEGGYELADFGSTNGVYINGEKVPRKRLSIGDIIRVGGTEIVFRS